MSTLTLPKPRGFQLQAASEFYVSFVPGNGMAAAAVDTLTFAFRLDGTFEAVAVALRERGDSILAEYAGTRDERALRGQLARMLGLDADGEAWLELGRRDPLVGRLQGEFPGFFTAAKPSPYDAATWAVLAQRMPMKAAAKLKIAMAEQLGDAVEVGGGSYRVFPSPTALERVERFAGVSAEKIERLRGVARAAKAGMLDPSRLRGMSEDAALADLMTLRGVGPWAASHILCRGAASPDASPTAEPRVLEGLADALGIETPGVPDFERVAEAWRPFRMWVAVLLARHLSRAGGWRRPGLSGARTQAGKRLERRIRSRPDVT
jgi:DNA-3-methyladenine glycosylase II